MSGFIIRTEEMTVEDISNFYVEDKYNRDILEKLKAPSPVLLIGSRGVGKSFLFRVCQNELNNEFSEKWILPVFLTFRKVSLIKSKNEQSFHSWMLGKIVAEVIRALKKSGVLHADIFNLLGLKDEPENTDSIVRKFEESYLKPGEVVDDHAIPELDSFLEAVEDLCIHFSIRRIIIFIDEAAHVFYPEQQREFFTLFRDLRSPYIKCNAAVYPGVTVYGDSFEPVHDAIEIPLTRKIFDENYVKNMREMVVRQADCNYVAKLSRQGEYFNTIAYACSGNPRYLFRSLEASGKFDVNSINSMFREYYRENLWAEHTKLSNKYPGYKRFIDWGRDFIENSVLPSLMEKNSGFINERKGKGTTAFFWLHKDVPQEVKEAIRLLEYSGLVYELSPGIRATRSEIGTRYMVNIGCLLALEATPLQSAKDIVSNLDIRRMVEYGKNHKLYEDIQGCVVGDECDSLSMQLKKSVKELDLTDFQKEKLDELHIYSLGELLQTKEEKLMQVKYIAEIRARQIKNACVAAVCEYLLG